MSDDLAVEREIGEQAGSGFGLRFDKSVVRLVDGLKSSLAEMVPGGQAVILTVTAPIKLRAKTATVLESLMRQGFPETERFDTIHGNQVRLRRLTGLAANSPKVLGFVHNPASDAGVILALAEAWLRKRV
jgi:hypothetical protein